MVKSKTISQVQTDPNQYLCYECALWHDQSVMQAYVQWSEVFEAAQCC